MSASEVAVNPATPPATVTTSKAGYTHLTEPQKRAIIAALGSGMTLQQVADRYGVNRSTIWRVKNCFVKSQPDSVLSDEWRSKLHNSLPTKAVAAIERSLDDTDDVHKAASTGVNVLKGLGHLQGDNVNVSIQAVLASIPPEMLAEMIVTPTPQDVVSGVDNKGVSDGENT